MLFENSDSIHDPPGSYRSNVTTGNLHGTHVAMRAFGVWCVMTHARPALVRALRAWGFYKTARTIEDSPSPGALRHVLSRAYIDLYPYVLLGPVRHDLIRAVLTLQAAAIFAGRGDGETAGAMTVSVFLSAAGAVSWQRPWSRLNWRRQKQSVVKNALLAQIKQRTLLNLPYRMPSSKSTVS